MREWALCAVLWAFCRLNFSTFMISKLHLISYAAVVRVGTWTWSFDVAGVNRSMSRLCALKVSFEYLSANGFTSALSYLHFLKTLHIHEKSICRICLLLRFVTLIQSLKPECRRCHCLQSAACCVGHIADTSATALHELSSIWNRTSIIVIVNGIILSVLAISTRQCA